MSIRDKMNRRYVLIRSGTPVNFVWVKSRPVDVVKATEACNLLVDAGVHAIVESCEVIDAVGLPTEWNGWAS